jgi:hypothetical protein
MPGEQSRQGWANTQLFTDIVESFGWKLRGAIDQNIDCEKCLPYKKGNPRTHGIDALFTLSCPYDDKISRAIVVDGKRYTMDSVGGPTKLKGWLEDTINTLVHARESLGSLMEIRNLPHNTIIDTALVAWDCHDGWDANKANGWISGISLGHRPIPPISAFLSTKDHLDRLQTVYQFSQTVTGLEFLYSIEKKPLWSSTLTPELLHSAILLVRYAQNGLSKKETGVLYFDIEKPGNIKFLSKYLHYSGLLTHDEITIHILCKKSDIEIFETLFKAEFEVDSGSNVEQAKFVFKQLVKSQFDS